METTELIRQAIVATGTVTAKLSTDQRSNATPCSDFDVHALASHLAGFYAGSARAGRKEAGPTGESSPDLLGSNPSVALAELGASMVEAWQTPGAFEGSTKFGRGDMPAQLAGTITFFETLMHGWDLAKATGQTFEVSQELAEASLATAQQICNDMSRERGAFGPEVAAAPGAGPFEQALALSGRDPGWSA